MLNTTASDKKMIWRGTGTVTVAAKPEKQEQQIQNVLDKMGAKWGKILKNEGEWPSPVTPRVET